MAKKFKDLAAPLYDDPDSRRRMAEIRAELEAELAAQSSQGGAGASGDGSLRAPAPRDH